MVPAGLIRKISLVDATVIVSERPFRLISNCMARERDLSKWEVQYTYASQEEYLSAELRSGVHSIHFGTQIIDLYVEDWGADVTIVTFNAAVPRSATTVPMLMGHGLASNTGINLVAVSDPTMAMGGVDLTVSWYLGNSEIGVLPPILAPLIQYAVDSLDSRRTILFGASGGGYAAVLYGQYFPDSLVLGVNPRLDLNALPKAATEKYLEIAHRTSETESIAEGEKFLPGKLSELYKASLPFDLCIYQNFGDRRFLDYQLVPLVKDLGDDPRLFTMLEWIRPGHVAIPGARLRNIVSRLAVDGEQEDAIIGAGFIPTVLNSKNKRAARRYSKLKSW